MSALTDGAQRVFDQSCLNSVIEAEEFNLVKVLRPSISIDGDQWCVLYGENLQDGVAGFGGSPIEAVYDFNKAWHVALPLVGAQGTGEAK